MKKHHMPDMKEGGVNVTPLIDIVMVLIIFFMLVAKIGVTRGVDEDIPLPSSILGKSLESLSNTLTINVHYNRSGEEPLLNAFVPGPDGMMKRELHISKKYASGTDQEMERVLKAFVDVNKDKANLIIRADRDLPYSQLELVLLSAANAGIGNISYETKSGTDDVTGAGSGGT
jgi:biopolymer transport protein ExbD